MFTYFGDTYGSTGTLISILIWVLIAIVVIEILRAIFGTTHRTHTPPALPPQPTVPPTIIASPAAKSPLDILNERYAKGEIHKDEFDQKKADILSHHVQ